MKKNLILFILLLVIIAGGWYLMSKQKGIETQTKDTSVVQMKGETKTWSTFSNFWEREDTAGLTTVNYEIKYPETWMATTERSGLPMSPDVLFTGDSSVNGVIEMSGKLPEAIGGSVALYSNADGPVRNNTGDIFSELRKINDFYQRDIIKTENIEINGNKGVKNYISDGTFEIYLEGAPDYVNGSTGWSGVYTLRSRLGTEENLFDSIASTLSF